MFPDKAVLINNIQRSNLKADKEFVCAAVLAYYKTLLEAQAVKPKTVVKKAVKKEETK